MPRVGNHQPHVDPLPDANRARERWVLIAVCLLALGLRVWGGLAFGLPYLYDPDESAFVNPALKMVWDSNLNPGWFGHPGSTVIYLNTAVFKLLSLAAPYLGLFDDMRGFRLAVLADPSLVYLLARSLYVLMGAATVWQLYCLARAACDRATALLAAGLLAVMALHVEFSQMVRTDIIVTLLAVMVGQQALTLHQTRSLKPYLVSGALVGMAVATKYPAVLIGVMVLVAHLLADGVAWRAWWKLVACGASALGSLFVCSPYLFIDHAVVRRDLAAEAVGIHLSAAGNGFWSNVSWYLDGPLPDVFGWWGLLLAVLGMAFGLRQRRHATTILLAFVLVYWLSISTLSLRWERWIIPILPFVALFAAAGATGAARFLSQRTPWVSQTGWWGLLGATLLVPMLWQTLAQGQHRSGPDTRTAARAWLLTHIPAGSRIVIETYGPQVPKDHYLLYNTAGNGMVRRPQGLRAHVIPSGFLGGNGTPEALAAAGVEYLVLSSFYERFKAMNKNEFQGLVANYERVLKESELVAEFLPVTGRQADPLRANREGGPYLRILKLPSPQKITP